MPEVSSHKGGLGVSSKTFRPLPGVASRSVASIYIMAQNNVIGFIQSMNINIQRPINAVFPIGQMAVLELVPGGLTGGGTLNIERMFLYSSGARIVNAIAPNSIKPNTLANNATFEVIVVGRPGTKLGANVVLQRFSGCWFESLGYDVAATSAELIVKEKATIRFAWVDEGDSPGSEMAPGQMAGTTADNIQYYNEGQQDINATTGHNDRVNDNRETNRGTGNPSSPSDDYQNESPVQYGRGDITDTTGA